MAEQFNTGDTVWDQMSHSKGTVVASRTTAVWVRWGNIDDEKAVDNLVNPLAITKTKPLSKGDRFNVKHSKENFEVLYLFSEYVFAFNLRDGKPCIFLKVECIPNGNKSLAANTSDIVTHTPRQIQVGDKVKCQVPGHIYTVVSIIDDYIGLKQEGMTPFFVSKSSRLTRV